MIGTKVRALGDRAREDLQANLTSAEWTDDEAFTAYGLDDATITALRTWEIVAGRADVHLVEDEPDVQRAVLNRQLDVDAGAD